MADDKVSGSGSLRQRPWDLVVETVLLELVGLAFCEIATLVSWLFGWLPDPTLGTLTTSMLALWPAVELYRAGPPRRLAIVAAVLAQAAVTLFGAAVANWALPASADSDVGILIGYVVAIPVGAAVFARLINRANVA